MQDNINQEINFNKEDYNNIVDNQIKNESNQEILNFAKINGINMDDNNMKLFEQFIQFQNFLNKNNTQNNQIINAEENKELKISNKNNPEKLKNELKKEIEQVKKEISNKNLKIIENKKEETEEDKIKKNKNYDDIPIKTFSQQTKNFDDIPIHSSSINFMELLEKNLVQNEEIENTLTIQQTKIIKKERFKKIINVSKPTENKKYKYYSDNFDIQDQNATKNERPQTPKKKRF